jgi:glycosyltransferase involved in cell wall biosynthesis
MENNFLTVIIPAYNTGNFLERCINSVINQSLKDLEVIIIDDNSTDNTFEIIQKYVKNFSNISFYHNSSNLGPGGSRNIGLKYVKTKYVCFLDSDDWIDTNAYKEAVNILEENYECDMTICGIKTEFDSPYCSSERYQYKSSNIITNQFALSLLCHTENQDISISSLLGNKVFRTKLIREKIAFEQLYFEDELFSFLCILNSKKIAILPDIYLHYYQRQFSIMHSFSKKYIDDTLQIFLILKNYLEGKNIFYEYQSYFYAFFMRCYISLMNTLFSLEQNVDVQRKYLLYFANSFEKNFNSMDVMNSMDIHLLKRIFLID